MLKKSFLLKVSSVTAKNDYKVPSSRSMADAKKRILNNIVPISSPTLALVAPS